MAAPTKPQLAVLRAAAINGCLWRMPGGWAPQADSPRDAVVNSRAVNACHGLGWLKHPQWLSERLDLTDAGRAALAQAREVK